MQMTKDQVKLELAELVEIAHKKSPECIDRVNVFDSIEDGMQLLRTCIKYMKLDIEALRRELKHARRDE